MMAIRIYACPCYMKWSKNEYCGNSDMLSEINVHWNESEYCVVTCQCEYTEAKMNPVVHDVVTILWKEMLLYTTDIWLLDLFGLIECSCTQLFCDW